MGFESLGGVRKADRAALGKWTWRCVLSGVSPTRYANAVWQALSGNCVNAADLSG